MTIAPIEQFDVPNLHALQPDGWGDITSWFEYYIATPYCFPVKITIKGKIVGIGSGIIMGRTGWLAHIIVHHAHRKKGIGSMILDHLISLLQGLSCETISLVATDQGYTIYKKAGFIQQTEYVLFERKKPLDAKLDSKNVHVFMNTDQEDILRLDREVSGEDRGKILSEHLIGSWVYKEDGVATGFYLPELGRGLIVASNPEAGIALMQIRLSRTNKGWLPIDNKDGIRFIENNGFKEPLRSKRMVLGKPFIWKPEKLYSPIGGNLG